MGRVARELLLNIGTIVSEGFVSVLLGRRRLFVAGLLLFTVSSLLDGLAWSEGSLIAFRSLQGLGAALARAESASVVTERVWSETQALLSSP